MRAWGVTYDTGFTNLGTTTHEPFDPGIVARDMQIIRADLHADAVRVTGGVADRLEIAARRAAAAGCRTCRAHPTGRGEHPLPHRLGDQHHDDRAHAR